MSIATRHTLRRSDNSWTIHYLFTTEAAAADARLTTQPASNQESARTVIAAATAAVVAERDFHIVDIVCDK